MENVISVMKGAEPFYYEGGSVGILLCHGFLGTPQSMSDLGKALHTLGFTVKGMRLKGHGTEPQELETCTYQDWQTNIEEEYVHLKKSCDKVFVMGQSMGGALTLHVASKFKEIDGIILINPALFIPGMEHFRLKSAFEYINESEPDIKQKGVEEITYHETPVHAYHQLLDIISEVSNKLSFVKCPVLCFQSSIDHVVPPENADFVMKHIRSSYKRKKVLLNSYHVASMDFEKEKIAQETAAFVNRFI